MNLPQGWSDTTVFTFQGPNDSGVQHNLVLLIDPVVEKNMKLVTYAQQLIQGSKTSLPGFEIINETEKILEQNIPAYEIVYKYIPADEVIIYQKQIITIIHGKGYTFTSSYSKKTLKTIANEVDEIIASFIPFTPPEDNEEED